MRLDHVRQAQQKCPGRGTKRTALIWEADLLRLFVVGHRPAISESDSVELMNEGERLRMRKTMRKISRVKLALFKFVCQEE